MFGLPITAIFSIMNVAPLIKQLLDSTSNWSDLDGAVRKLIPTLVPILESIAEKLFPNLAPEFRLAAAVTAAYNQDKTKWLQQSLNVILTDEEDLDVDGVYGPKTVRGVELVQQHLGLTDVDGWAFKITNTAIQFVLNKMFAEDELPKPAPATVLKVAQAPAVAPNLDAAAAIA